MGFESIPVNTGTGPSILTDQSGTAYAQVVKIVQGADGVFDSLASTLAISGTVSATVASITTGTINVVNVLSASGVTIANITTGTVTVVGTVAVSGGGGGAQYSAGNTDMGATGTGTIALGIQSGATTGRAIAVSATGGIHIASMPAVGGGQQYVVDSTALANTGTGTLVLGMQSGATTARGIALTTTGAQHVSVQNVVSAANVTIASVTTGTMNVINVLSASGVTIASVTTGTMNVINVLSASGVTIASVTTGTLNVVNVLSATGVLLAATTANVGAFVGTAHASKWNAFAVNTTSGASTIIKTSGANTLYITSLLVSVNTQCRVDLYSAATTLLSVYLATFGGFTLPISAEAPLVLNSNQSLTFTPSVSGSAMCYAAGYTFT